MKRDVAVMLLYSADGRVLLQHRTSDAPTFPDYWCPFGGGIDKGETPEQAVKREIQEELCYTLDAPEFVFSEEFSDEYQSGTKHVFIELYDESKELNQCEGDDMVWATLNDLKELRLVPQDIHIIKKILDTLARS